MLRRAGQHAGLRAPRQRRLALQQLPHHARLLADARGAAHRPQLAQREHGRRGRDGHRVSRHELRASSVHRTAGRDPAAQRLRHRHVRQMPRAAAVGIECLRADGPLAGALRLRQVLRVSSGRVRPLLPGPVRWRDAHPDSARSGLPRQHRHHRQGHRLGPHPAVAHAGQTVLHLLRGGGHARSASCAQGMDRQVQGQVRPGLGQAARGDAGPADHAGHGAARTPSSRRCPKW